MGWRRVKVRRLNGAMASYYIAPNGPRFLNLSSAKGVAKLLKKKEEEEFKDAKEELDEDDEFVDAREEQDQERGKKRKRDGISPPRADKKRKLDLASPAPIKLPEDIKRRRKMMAAKEKHLLKRILTRNLNRNHGGKAIATFLKENKAPGPMTPPKKSANFSDTLETPPNLTPPVNRKASFKSSGLRPKSLNSKIEAEL